MKKGAVLALSLVGALLALPVSSSAAAVGVPRPLPVCGPAKAPTMAAWNAGRVYYMGPDEPGVYGCLAGERSLRLGVDPDSFGYIDPRRIVLRPPWVAYFGWTIEVDIGDMHVGATNLRTGHSWTCDLGPWSSSAGVGLWMTKLVVAETGTAGWVGRRVEWRSIDGPLLKFDEVAICRGGKLRRLDAGEGIERDSLRLDGRVMSWVGSGGPRSIRLP